MKKITVGFVIQDYSESGQFVGQEFVAGEATWEDDDGNPIDCPMNDQYQPFDMIQPEKGA